MKESDDRIAGLLRVSDRDRYLSVLYAPEDKREGLFALYAFNAEIASIRDRIREALPGEIRLQWWRDTLTASQEQGHPLAAALARTIDIHELPRAAFDRYLEARIFDLYNDAMPDRNALEGYCGETASAVIQLAGLILDRSLARDHAELCGHAGCAQAMAGLLRLLPIHRARGQCYIPRNMLAAAGTTPEEFIAGGARQSARRVVEEMIALTEHHMRVFQEGARHLPPCLRPAFLPVALVPAYIKELARDTGRTLHMPVGISEIRRHWLTFCAAMHGWPGAN